MQLNKSDMTQKEIQKIYLDLKEVAEALKISQAINKDKNLAKQLVELELRIILLARSLNTLL